MDTKGIIATVLGVIALVAFGCFAYYLVKHIGEGQQQWDRLVYIFGGVEAVAFAAAGYFFGKEVNRARAETAEKRANDAEQKADNAKETVKEAQEKITKAEDKLSSLLKYIESQAPSSSTGSEAIEEISNLARQRGIQDKIPDFMTFIETKHNTLKAKSDERWERLSLFAKSLSES